MLELTVRSAGVYILIAWAKSTPNPTSQSLSSAGRIGFSTGLGPQKPGALLPEGVDSIWGTGWWGGRGAVDNPYLCQLKVANLVGT